MKLKIEQLPSVILMESLTEESQLERENLLEGYAYGDSSLPLRMTGNVRDVIYSVVEVFNYLPNYGY